MPAVPAHAYVPSRPGSRWRTYGKSGFIFLFHRERTTGNAIAENLSGRIRGRSPYRIALAAASSKYLDETEKNLSRLFEVAGKQGAILFFDEADALFGKRTEVKDAHDRYANLEISYLLERMERFKGLAILATNRRKDLDEAFLRRLRFVIEFPFPDVPQRAEIWRRAFPEATPTEALDHDRLARLNIAGGVIRSIALNAAFLAAHAGVPVDMQHVNRAARDEYQKLEKPYDGVL